MASTGLSCGHPGERERGGQPGLDEAESSGRHGDLGQQLSRTEGKQNQRGPRRRPDRRKRGEQRRVVERPAADGRGQGALPAWSERAGRMRSRSRTEPLRQAGELCRAATQTVAHPLQNPVRPIAVRRRASGPAPPARTGPRTGTSSGDRPPRAGCAAPPRARSPARQAPAGQARPPNVSRLEAVRPATARAGRGRPAQASCTAARLPTAPASGCDLGQRVARQLRGDHRPPPACGRARALERPQTGERAAAWSAAIAGNQARRDLLPGPSQEPGHFQHARRHQIERDAPVRGDPARPCGAA